MYKNEKYGFIYIWRDRKRNMYYIGCHWGTIEDGYICSSTRMRNAYRRRPKDFKRRIIWKTTDRSLLLEEEHRWLLLISDEQLGKKYYNLRKHHFGHWSNNPEAVKSIGQKLSESKKKYEERSGLKWGHWSVGKKVSEETKEKLSISHKGLKSGAKGKKWSDESRQKVSQQRKGIIAYIPNDETKEKCRQGRIGKKMSPESKAKMMKSRWGIIL